jgi:hypothetical protein
MFTGIEFVHSKAASEHVDEMRHLADDDVQNPKCRDRDESEITRNHRQLVLNSTSKSDQI